MIRHFTAFLFTALAVSLVVPANLAMAQTRPGTAPTRPLANPFGSTSAISGQSRPLGGVPASGYRRGYPSGNYERNGRGGYGNYGGTGAYGGVVYAPSYWDYVGDPAPGPGSGPGPGPYSYTWPSYSMAPPPLPPGPGAPPAPQGPPVIINQYFGYPGPPPGADVSEPQAEGGGHPGDPLSEPANYYLIAYKDHSVHAALAYWVEGNTLHYVTTDNAHNQVSLNLVDVPASTRLNSDHNVPFSLAGK